MIIILYIPVLLRPLPVTHQLFEGQKFEKVQKSNLLETVGVLSNKK